MPKSESKSKRMESMNENLVGVKENWRLKSKIHGFDEEVYKVNGVLVGKRRHQK